MALDPDIEAAIASLVDTRSEQLLDISHDLWDHPELAYDEVHAHEVLCAALEDAGMEVERSAYDIPTAFRATAGSEGPLVAVCCEYDALPGIGHGCGHNVIAAAGLGAGLAAAALAEELGGRVVVLGTPAEEGGGGKVLMIERGAFDGVTAALMVHPADADLDSFHAIAVHELRCEYHGRAAHAAAAPEHGRNALDAAVLGYVNVAALRQHIASDERVHGIITHGGDKPNVVPAYAASQWYVRSPTRTSLALLEPRVEAALTAGAAAAGCEMTSEWPNPAYDELLSVPSLDAVYAHHAARRGRRVHPKSSAPRFVGSTDMGNVSHVVPSIHPMVAVAPPGVAIHTEEFALSARGTGGDRGVLDGAYALAATVAEVWSDAALRTHALAELSASRAQ